VTYRVLSNPTARKQVGPNVAAVPTPSTKSELPLLRDPAKVDPWPAKEIDLITGARKTKIVPEGAIAMLMPVSLANTDADQVLCTLYVASDTAKIAPSNLTATPARSSEKKSENRMPFDAIGPN
jgi:hypothetical protein